MKTKTIFLNKKNQKDSSSFSIIEKAINGRYGYYSNYGGNLSEKKMNEIGYTLVELNTKEVERLEKLQIKRKKRLEKQYRENKLREREDQVNICLATEPLKIEKNPNFGINPIEFIVNLSDTPMIDAYHGCGKGTAYVKNNQLIAFHYGYEQPNNTPTDCEVLQIELSSTQICM